MEEEVKTESQTVLAEQASTEDSVDGALLEEAIKAGVLYGRKKSRTNPRMRSYIYMTRNGIEMFDFTQTAELLDRAKTFLKEVVTQNSLVLLVGTLPASKTLVRAFAEQFAFPYVTERWLGGTLTNFKTLSQRIGYYTGLKVDKASGKLEKYTKKERGQFDKQIVKMDKLFGGIERLKEMPKAVIVVNPTHHQTAVLEALRMKIPVIALMNSDANPDQIQYPVTGNDNSKTSVNWFLGQLQKAAEEGVRSRKTPTVSPK